MSNSKEKCFYCGEELEWDEVNEKHGNLFVCESCGDYFCEQCFIDRLGSEKFQKMMDESPICECPTCFERDDISMKDRMECMKEDAAVERFYGVGEE